MAVPLLFPPKKRAKFFRVPDATPTRTITKMTVHQLKISQVVAKHLNTTKVAKEIGISQPPISKRSRLLEQECGTQKEIKRFITYGSCARLSRNAKDFLAFRHRWPAKPTSIAARRRPVAELI
jgi:Bacterial regulatory helix-turn-helix protein, lysR family